jgi:hypothetical protein
VKELITCENRVLVLEMKEWNKYFWWAKALGRGLKETEPTQSVAVKECAESERLHISAQETGTFCAVLKKKSI